MANLIETLRTGIDAPLSTVAVIPFTYHILLAAFCAIILEFFYVKFGTSLSNRKKVARNFLLITLTTTLVITIVKSSLALSLGLVGALSIVRFRTAVKEQEELAYLFLSISLGLGFGAGQTTATLLAFFLILLIIYLRKKRVAVSAAETLFLNITSKKGGNLTVQALIKMLSPYCSKIDLKRFDEASQNFEVSFYLEFKNLEKMDQCLQALRKYLPSAQITLLDQSGIML